MRYAAGFRRHFERGVTRYVATIQVGTVHQIWRQITAAIKSSARF
jgi:hypothetical protein